MPILSALGGLAARGYGLLAGAGGVFNWSRTITNPNASGPLNGAEVDSSGNIYGVGMGEVSGTLYPYIVAFSGTGTLLWQKRLSQSASSTAAVYHGASADSLGNLYVAGGVASQSSLQKFDSSGSIVWQFYQNGNSFFYDVEVMPNGNIVFAGVSDNGTYDQASTTVVDSSGSLQWNSFIQSTSSTWRWNGVSVDSSSNIYCSGNNATTTPYNRTIKFNSSGTVQWSTRQTASGFYNGNVYDSVNSRLYSVGSNGTGAMLFAQNASTGASVWAVGYGSGYYQDVDVDSAGNVYCLYQTSSATETGVHKYDSSGTLVWQRIFVRGSGDNVMNGIKAIDDENFVLVGVWDNNDYSMVATFKTDGTEVTTASWSWSASALTANTVSSSSSSNSGTNQTGLDSVTATGYSASIPSYTWGSIVTY